MAFKSVRLYLSFFLWCNIKITILGKAYTSQVDLLFEFCAANDVSLLFLQIQRDITELQKFEAESTRSRVKDILAVQIRKLQTDLKRHEAELRGASSSSDALSEKGTVSLPRTPVYTEIIKNYGIGNILCVH